MIVLAHSTPEDIAFVRGLLSAVGVILLALVVFVALTKIGDWLKHRKGR